MVTQYTRTAMLIGSDTVEKLRRSRVLVFGVGGVGAYAIEALARAGVGTLEIVDHDTVCLTNLNRQIIALHSTIGLPKVEVMAKRIADIDPECRVIARQECFNAQTADSFHLEEFDYVVDAIDMVSSKLLLARLCFEKKIPLISSMGTGNKLDPSAFRIRDLYETSGDPLARIMRKELRKMGVTRLCVVCSEELAREPVEENPEPTTKRSTPGTLSFVPGAAGLVLAGKVIRDLCGLTVG